MQKQAKKLVFLGFFLLFQLGFSNKSFDLPISIKALGLSVKDLISYEIEGETAYYTFSDSRTDEDGDIVTFVVTDEVIQERFKGVENKVFEMGL